MGGSTWSKSTFDDLKQTRSTQTQQQIFTQQTIATEMSPKGLVIRESRDSDAHPESLAIVVALDQTGSMGRIPEILVREKLGALMNTLIDHGITHPQILFAAIGDHYSDHHPLQIGQYESGTKELDMWLTKIFLEGNGGGQNMESYLLAWLFAGRYTSLDCFEKRKQKGFVFTIGDEYTHKMVEGGKIEELFGLEKASDATAEQLLAEAQRANHVFHLHVTGSMVGRENFNEGLQPWKDLLGERVIVVDDYTIIAEIIASTVAMIHGIDLATVTKSFDDATAGKVTNALAHISKDIQKSETGVLAL